MALVRGNRVTDLAEDRARERGHLPMRDDARHGRVALICVHCGARATHVNRELRGLLTSEQGKCFGFEPKSRRQQELESDDGAAWDPSPSWSAIEVANWATRTATAQRLAYEQKLKERA